MGKPKKYANLTDMTQCHPSPRGGSICFRPGEAREGEWWSRFVRNDGTGLQEVPLDYIPSRDFKKLPRAQRPVTSPRVVSEQPRASTGCSSRCDSSCQVACENTCQMTCEQSKQTIAVFDTYEKVGATYYCRFCEWSTTDAERVEKHMEAYHPEKKKRPVKEGSQESWSGDQDVLDPDASGGQPSGTESPAVPTSGSPPSEPRAMAKELKKDSGNGYWKIEDGLFVCVKCEEIAGVRWTTTGQSHMTRHAKKTHGYDPEKVRQK